MRTINAAALAAVATGRFHKRNAIRFDMPGGAVGFWDDAYEINNASVTYFGLGGAMSITVLGSGADFASRSVDVTISGLDPLVISRVEAQPWHQQPVTIYQVVVPVDTPQLVYFDVWFVGFLDNLKRREQLGGTAQLIGSVESIAREFGRRGARTRSDADQRQIDADDGFYKHAAVAGNTSINWGVRPEQPQQSRKKLFGIL